MPAVVMLDVTVMVLVVVVVVTPQHYVRNLRFQASMDDWELQTITASLFL